MVKIEKLRKRKPKFPRVSSKTKKKVDGSKWRKQTGLHGRIKKHLSHNKGAVPNIGYGFPKAIRGRHSSGLKMVLVSNLKEIESIDPKKELIKISNVGLKKKLEIVKKAISKGIKISNLRKPKEYLEKNVHKSKKAKKEETKKEVKK